MTHEVAMTKGKDGWKASTTIMLPGVPDLPDTIDGDCPAFVEISTSKITFGKGIRTTAHVGYKTPFGFRTRISFAGDGDWSRTVKSDPTARCTEKTVKTMHDESLMHLDLILSLIGEHYKVSDPMGATAAA